MSPLRFLHIPKTAGTSLTESLHRVYREAEFTFSGNPQEEAERYRTLPVSARQRIVLISGHAPRITGIDEIDTLPTITLLRHPVDRVKSFFRHVSEGKSPHLAGIYPPETFDLDEFLDSGNGELSNFQAKTLLGEGNYDLPSLDRKTLIARARASLEENLSAFGVVEHFEKSLVFFHHRFDWKRRPLYRQVNKSSTSNRIDFLPSHLQRIKELNDVDIPLYNTACRLFNRQIEDVYGLEFELARFRRHQALFAPYFCIYAWLGRLKSRATHNSDPTTHKRTSMK